MKPNKSICVYCGSQPGANPEFMSAAESLGYAIAKQGFGLVYGGGTNGLMGQVARSVHENGGYVTGIIPKFLLSYEANEEDLGFIDNLIVTSNMHERKAMMFEEADAFVTLPGGIGTLEEVIEIMTWAQLDRHQKPIAFVNTTINGEGYWGSLFQQFEKMTDSGFLHNIDKIQPIIDPSPEDLVEKISQQLR